MATTTPARPPMLPAGPHRSDGRHRDRASARALVADARGPPQGRDHRRRPRLREERDAAEVHRGRRAVAEHRDGRLRHEGIARRAAAADDPARPAQALLRSHRAALARRHEARLVPRPRRARVRAHATARRARLDRCEAPQRVRADRRDGRPRADGSLRGPDLSVLTGHHRALGHRHDGDRLARARRAPPQGRDEPRAARIRRLVRGAAQDARADRSTRDRQR